MRNWTPRLTAAVPTLLFLGSFTFTGCAQQYVKKAPAVGPFELASIKKEVMRDAVKDKIDEAASAALTIRSIRFGYDQYGLTPEARAILKDNAAVLKRRGEKTVIINGHADERGTTAYNLALSEKRALVVREYYEKLGIPAVRVITRPYGEEKPICLEKNDACWRANRRAETVFETRSIFK